MTSRTWVSGTTGIITLPCLIFLKLGRPNLARSSKLSFIHLLVSKHKTFPLETNNVDE